MAKASTDPDLPIAEALEAAFRQASEVRLLAAGKGKPGLFPATQAGKRLAERCLDAPNPLLRVTRTEVVKGNEQRFVTITPAGIGFLAQHASETKRKELMDGTQVPPSRAAEMIKSCIRLANRRFESVMTDVSETLQAHRQTVAELQEALQSYADRVAESATELQGELESLKGESAALRTRLEGIPLSPPEPPTAEEQAGPEEVPDEEVRFAPVTPDDPSFEQALSLAKEMVFAWDDASDPDTREVIEAAMRNGGVEPIGEPGELLSFDPTFHDGPNIASGANVEVLKPGWLLQGARNRYVLARAKVQLKDGRAESIPHARTRS